MTVVMDTNVFVVACLPHHKYYQVTDALLNERYVLAVSNEILLEYQEMITLKLGEEHIKTTVDVIVDLPNVRFIDPRFKWQLITADPDDDKFSDCAIASNATYIVTEDKHFREAELSEFPTLSVIDLNTFLKLL